MPAITPHRRLVLLLAGLLLAGPLLAAKPADFDAQLTEFVDEMVAKHGFERAALAEMLAGASYQQKVIDRITRPAEALPWKRYRKIFVTDERAGEGVVFWQAHTDLLQRAEREYGVPPEIIVAIIGVESRYGRHRGKDRALDSLATLAFAYPKRGAFFRSELEQLLLLSREERVAPAEVLGSYAGALGMPQFIPSSYRAYAVDFDGDGRRDLWRSKADVIGSVAAYFSRHGWQPGGPVTTRALQVDAGHRHFAEAGMKPSLEVGELMAAGIRPQQPLPADTRTSLVRLRGADGDEYWLGLQNFYTITRYNHSNLYAMAVFQLAERIRELQQQAVAKSGDA